MSELRKRTFGDPRHAPARAYPVGQWNHGRGGKGGGLELPTRHFQDPAALSLPAPVEVAHSEATEQAYLLPAFHLAVAGWKAVRWERRHGQIVEAAPPDLAEPWNRGYRSRRQVIGVVKELWEAGHRGFVVLSVRATASQDLARVLGQAGRFRLAAGQTAAGKAFPEYAFWIPIATGEPERVTNHDGQSSVVTPIVSLLPDKPTEADFSALLIPPEVQEFIESRLDEVAAWEAGGANGATEQPRPAGAREASPAEESAPIEPPVVIRRNGRAHAGRRCPDNGDDYGVDYLRLTVPFGTKEHPEFRGRSLGDLLDTPEGRRFVRYLAGRHEPKGPAQKQIVRAARALAAAGLAG